MESKKMRLLAIVLAVFHLQMTSTASKASVSSRFVLVHGSCHGAWSWYKLVALLRSSGHNVTALDLGASGINPKQFYEVKTVSDYFRPLMEFMSSDLRHDERVILVGHSLGGYAVSQAMEIFPEKISVAVFLTASMPGPHLNSSSLLRESLRRQGSPQLDSRFIYTNGPNNPPTAFEFGPKALAEMVYQRSPIEDLALANMLVRPLYLYNEAEMAKIKLSTENYGSVRRVFIKSEEDKLMEKDLQEWMIEKNPPNEVREIRGSDHMVMFSKPTDLFLCLLSIAHDYCSFC